MHDATLYQMTLHYKQSYKVLHSCPTINSFEHTCRHIHMYILLVFHFIFSNMCVRVYIIFHTFWMFVYLIMFCLVFSFVSKLSDICVTKFRAIWCICDFSALHICWDVFFVWFYYVTRVPKKQTNTKELFSCLYISNIFIC